MASGYGGGSFSTLAREMQSAAVQFAAVTSGVAVLAQSVNSFRQLEKQLTLTNAVSEGTVQNFRSMEKAARDFALASNFGAAESAKALYDLASAGFTATESLSAMSGVLLLAQATMAEASESADLIGSNIRAFGLEAQDATRVSNLFAAAIARSQADMPKLAFGFRQVGPVAKVANLQIEETTALLGLLFNVGLRGEQAGTALRNVIVRLANPVGEAAEILDQLGIATTTADGKLINFFETMEKIKGRDSGEADLARLFGTEGLAGSVALLDGMGEKYTKLKGQITDTSFAWKMAQQQLNTLDGSMRLITNSATEFGIVIGEQVAPYIREFSNFIVDLTQEWRDLPKRVQDTYAEFAIFAVKSALVGVVLYKLGKTVIDIGLALVDFRRKWLAANAAIAAGTAGRLTSWIVAAGPWAAAIAAIGAALVGMYAVFQRYNMQREIEAAFALKNIEPVEKFADDLQRSLSRVRSTFQKGGFGDLDAQGALADIQNNAKSSIELQTAKVKELKDEQKKFEAEFKEFDALNEKLVAMVSGKTPKQLGDLRRRLSAVIEGGGDTKGIADFLIEEARQNGFSEEQVERLRKAIADDGVLFARLEELTANARSRGKISAPEIADLFNGLFMDTGQIYKDIAERLAKEVATADEDSRNAGTVFKQAAKQRMERAESFINVIVKEAGGMNNAVLDNFKDEIRGLLADPGVRAELATLQASSTKQVGIKEITDFLTKKLVADGVIGQDAVDALDAEGKRRLVLLDIGGREINSMIRQLQARTRKIAGEVNNNVQDMLAADQYDIAEDVKAQQLNLSEKITKSLEDMLTGNSMGPKIDPKLASLISGATLTRRIVDEAGKASIETLSIADDGFMEERERQLKEKMLELVGKNATPDTLNTLQRRIDQGTAGLESIIAYRKLADKKALNNFIEVNQDFENQLQDIASQSVKIKFESGVEAGAMLNGFIMPLEAEIEQIEIEYAEQLRAFNQKVEKIERENEGKKNDAAFQQDNANVRNQMARQANTRIAAKREANRKEIIAYRQLMEAYNKARREVENDISNIRIGMMPELGMDRINAQYEQEIKEATARAGDELRVAMDELEAKYTNIVSPENIRAALDQIGNTGQLSADMLSIIPEELDDELRRLNARRNAQVAQAHQQGLRTMADNIDKRKTFLKDIERRARESQSDITSMMLDIPGGDLDAALTASQARFDAQKRELVEQYEKNKRDLLEAVGANDPSYQTELDKEASTLQAGIAVIDESARRDAQALRIAAAKSGAAAKQFRLENEAARAERDAGLIASSGFNPAAVLEANKRQIEAEFQAKMNSLDTVIQERKVELPDLDVEATRKELTAIYEGQRDASIKDAERNTRQTITDFENSQRDMIEGIQDSILNAQRQLAAVRPFDINVLEKIDREDIESQVREAGQQVDDEIERLRIEGRLSPQVETAMMAHKEELQKTVREGLTIQFARDREDAARDLRDQLAQFGEDARLAINEAQIAIASTGSGGEAIELADLFAIRDTEEITSRFNQQLRSLEATYTDLKRQAGDNVMRVAELDTTYQKLKNAINAARDAELERSGSAEGTARRNREAMEQTVQNMIDQHRYSGTVMEGIEAGILQSSLDIQSNFELGMDMTKNVLTGTIDLMEAGFTRGREGFADMLADMGRQLIKAQAYQLLLRLGMAAVGAWGAGTTTLPTQGPAFGAMGARSEKGNVFEGGNLRRFARGGVVERLTEFSTRDGKRNTMAENGPEAIMPLQRTADGRLGVAGIGGGANNNFNINVAVNANGGQPAQNEDLARQIGKQIDMQVRAIVGAELRTQSRPGGTMNRR